MLAGSLTAPQDDREVPRKIERAKWSCADYPYRCLRPPRSSCDCAGCHQEQALRDPPSGGAALRYPSRCRTPRCAGPLAGKWILLSGAEPNVLSREPSTQSGQARASRPVSAGPPRAAPPRSEICCQLLPAPKSRDADSEGKQHKRLLGQCVVLRIGESKSERPVSRGCRPWRMVKVGRGPARTLTSR